MGYLSSRALRRELLCYARILYAPNVWLGRLATLLLAGGIVLHYFALLDRSHGTHAVPYDDLYGSMSLFAWLLGITYLGLENISPPAFGGRIRDAAAGRVDGGSGLARARTKCRLRRRRAVRFSLFT